ncbi:MAG: head-tail connector protein [Peptostreptococcus porci]|uniref:Phage gp6-like head-tail connector protein n=1 Tax=Peptostreptococcus porci TaxID=2652282 RepID=A0A6N7X245_9FIRM|nr:head-tail connector protein [Peptostreptococcus porci]MDY5479003.1 head-tail connector protein [Peptostreptococcus porci]MST63070.1 phage gp6-like head-tail connector protein [Peptostreptococcus porci]
MDLEYVMNYLRVDADEDIPLITNLITASESYLSGAIDDYDQKMESEKFRSMADLIRLAMISEWYDNRVYVKNDRYDKVSTMIRSLIHQLQYSSVEVI